ncbi:MAG: YkgJ family cysteine cluster protein [Hyphomicrobiales bacterium]|nr:YkgJ family cysteine cluster protein [Hyphomicrobiales bacterium]
MISGDSVLTRQQRRQEKRARDKRRAEWARSAPKPSSAACTEQADVLLGVLEQTGDRDRATNAAEIAHAGFERSLAAHFDPGRAKVACRQGCAFCCHTYVSVSAPEALRAARAVNALDQPERDDAIARIHAADNVTRGLDPDARKGQWIACPILIDNRCAIYTARPLACRAEMSINAVDCETVVGGSAGQVMAPAFPVQLKVMYSSALALAMKHAGLRTGIYEFNAALRIAVETPDAEARWLKGEDVFAPAAIHPSVRARIDQALNPTQAK